MQEIKKKELWKNFILLLLTIFIMIIIIEIFLRIFYPQQIYNECYGVPGPNDSRIDIEPNPYFGWFPIPNSSSCHYQQTQIKLFIDCIILRELG